MSEARIDASVTLEDVVITKAQDLQYELYQVFQDYGAEGQVAVVFDTREHDHNENFPSFVTGAAQSQQEVPQQAAPEGEEVPAEAAGQGQYL